MAPGFYMLDRYLDVYDRLVPDLPKYVLGVPPSKIDVRLDLKSEPQPLNELLGKPETSNK